MTSKKFLVRLAALLTVFMLVAAACGDDSSDDSSGGESSGELDGVSVSVGSKDFTENILLGEMLAQALEAKGADIDNQVNLGGTQVNREALLAGDLDVYPDYNGTGWTEHLGNGDPVKDSQELYDNVAEQDLADNGINWVGLSPFNDTYGFAANPDIAAEIDGDLNLQAMADYLEANPDKGVCLETEFPDRSDGLVLFEEATGYEVPQDQIQILDTGLIYTETQNGACDFGEVFTTDGRIDGLGLELVQDPGVFILYNLSYTWEDGAYQENADVYDEVVDAILAPLDEAKMTALNGQVDLEGIPAEDVANEYLKEIGLI
jgi:osmoprotectant transport system substrate-binding protein